MAARSWEERAQDLNVAAFENDAAKSLTERSFFLKRRKPLRRRECLERPLPGIWQRRDRFTIDDYLNNQIKSIATPLLGKESILLALGG